MNKTQPVFLFCFVSLIERFQNPLSGGIITTDRYLTHIQDAAHIDSYTKCTIKTVASTGLQRRERERRGRGEKDKGKIPQETPAKSN